MKKIFHDESEFSVYCDLGIYKKDNNIREFKKYLGKLNKKG